MIISTTMKRRLGRIKKCSPGHIRIKAMDLYFVDLVFSKFAVNFQAEFKNFELLMLSILLVVTICPGAVCSITISRLGPPT